MKHSSASRTVFLWGSRETYGNTCGPLTGHAGGAAARLSFSLKQRFEVNAPEAEQHAKGLQILQSWDKLVAGVIPRIDISNGIAVSPRSRSHEGAKQTGHTTIGQARGGEHSSSGECHRGSAVLLTITSNPCLRSRWGLCVENSGWRSEETRGSATTPENSPPSEEQKRGSLQHA